MSSLIVVVKSLFFPQFVHLNWERGKVTAVTIVVSGHWGTGERGKVTAVTIVVGTGAPGREVRLRLSIAGGRAWHSGAI